MGRNGDDGGTAEEAPGHRSAADLPSKSGRESEEWAASVHGPQDGGEEEEEMVVVGG